MNYTAIYRFNPVVLFSSFFLSHRYGEERYSVFRAYLYLHLHEIVSDKSTQGGKRGKIIPPSTLLIFILRDEHIHRPGISLDILYSIYSFVSLPFLFMFPINLLTHFCRYLNESNIFHKIKIFNCFISTKIFPSLQTTSNASNATIEYILFLYCVCCKTGQTH